MLRPLEGLNSKNQRPKSLWQTSGGWTERRKVSIQRKVPTLFLLQA